ncbi:HEPN domain-containing protein [Bacillus toyonensis]|uniref:ApeA N-terminal domain 1-containing protein n=1 Tax=Bacillus toyonensis TaxID=155322 RepID=UPI000BFB9D44|nr:HEPN domain-containing protein [Bacillus toyonensis]PHF44650.1 hypothetical protein COI39_14245 [Bacillus toyonensis]
MFEDIKNLTMYDEFTLDGYWWIPGFEDNKLSGTLTYNTDGITLNLFGNSEKGYKFPMDIRYPVLQGEVANYGAITLYDGFLRTWGLNNLGTLTLNFTYLLVGTHFNTKEDTILSSLSINYSSLESWFGENLPTESKKFSNEEHEKIEITYTFPSNFKTYIYEKQAQIQSSHTVKTTSKGYKFHMLDNQATLDIIPNTPMGLEWYLDMIRELQDFLTLMANRAIYLKQIHAERSLAYEVNGLEKNVYFFFSPEKSFEEKDFSLLNLHINYRKIENNLGIILNNWFTDPSYSSRKIYLRNLYDKQIDQEGKFLNYVKAMESFHRDTSGNTGQFLPNDVYEPIKMKMLDSIQQGDIKNETYNNFKNKMSSTLNFAHHFGFERRIRDMFKDIDERIKNITFPDGMNHIKNFARNVTITRDYYTHYGEIPDYYFKGLDLNFVNVKLHVILYYHFCKRLGIEGDIFCHALQSDMAIKHNLNTKTEPNVKETIN